MRAQATVPQVSSVSSSLLFFFFKPCRSVKPAPVPSTSGGKSETFRSRAGECVAVGVANDLNDLVALAATKTAVDPVRVADDVRVRVMVDGALVLYQAQTELLIAWLRKHFVVAKNHKKTKVSFGRSRSRSRCGSSRVDC